MIEINSEKKEILLPEFSRLLDEFEVNLAPWQEPRQVDGTWLFPRENNAATLEFLFLLGALNYSYWLLEDRQIVTWGIGTENGQNLRDVFALAYTLAYARAKGQLEFSAEYYHQFSEADARQIFSGAQSTSCDLPLLASRVRKVNELGLGLEKFGRDHSCPARFVEFCRLQNTLEEFLGALADYFPYAFGDPLRKLSQLLFKMIVDRRPEQLPSGGQLSTSTDYEAATNFQGIDQLAAQPDYMLPLFCLKTGLWDLDQSAEKFFTDYVELPADHPFEQEIREKTVRTVDLIAGDLAGNTGLNAGRVDSLMWRTAVEGCFPGDCGNCSFNSVCGTQNELESRRSWHHHLTRTPYY